MDVWTMDSDPVTPELSIVQRQIMVTRRFVAAVRVADAEWGHSTFPLWTGEVCGAQLVPSRERDAGINTSETNGPLS
jgi:hypothetical protein